MFFSNKPYDNTQVKKEYIITPETKISELIEMNPEAIEAIASINKHFRKLNNPFLRKTLAKRVSIRDAAKIGNVSVETFMKKLESIGFKTGMNNSTAHSLEEKPEQEVNIELTNNKEQMTNPVDVKIELDVRPGLEKGIDPFQEIMKNIKTLKEGEVLKVINSFEPLPLINILRSKGYKSWTEREGDAVITYFQKSPEAVKAEQKGESEPVQEFAPESFEATMARFAGKMIDLDVRGLEMPEPMMRILEKI